MCTDISYIDSFSLHSKERLSKVMLGKIMLWPQVYEYILAVSVRVKSKECLLGRRALPLSNLAYVPRF
jgi:hypothetical protein